MIKNLHTETFYLSAGECGPERRLPITLLTGQIIECATHHSNDCGAGYNDLIAHGQAWILSRLAIEMSDYPLINETYSITTWVESTNRRFSERNFEIRNCRHEIIGYARTIWMAIDIERRCVADISRLTTLTDIILDRPCPIARPSRHQPVEHPTKANIYTFRYCDMDFNRHVNTVRYIEVIMDQWSLEFHDAHAVRRLDISFLHEAYCDDTARVATEFDNDKLLARTDIIVNDNVSCHAAIEFTNNIWTENKLF